ncbi:MAG: hypothetical protein K6B41_02280 [Butyrivibrio sp.]|nr:hypothetical protein [Butyrivibrio sp.]
MNLKIKFTQIKASITNKRRKRNIDSEKDKKFKFNKNRKSRTYGSGKFTIIICGILTITVFAVLGIGFWKYNNKSKEEQKAKEKSELAANIEIADQIVEPEKVYLNEEVKNAIINAGQQVTDGLDKRPDAYDLTNEELSEFATIESCEIGTDGKINITVISPGLVTSDDKMYYLFEEKTYEDEIAEDAEPLISEYNDSETTFSVNLNKGSADSRLYSKFVVAVKKGDEYVEVCTPSYVTNPEAVAGYNYSGMSQDSIKGLLVDPSRLSEIDDLGVNYATYNIPLNRLLTTSSAGSVAYSYDGVTYYFNSAILDEYDYLFETLNNKGIDIAAIILNNASTSSYPEITHPDARSGSTAPYYMFNASDESGVKALSAVGSFLASRYSGAGHGNVSMWIIGNEVNAKKEWNYMNTSDFSSYTAAYTRAFRVFYNAIKSVNAGAKVYISLDQQWDRNRSSSPDFDARDMLDTFASSLKKYGDINWGIAYHPYSYPNENTAFWNSSSLVTHSSDTSIITMDNIEVLTNYMQQESLLNEAGSIRSIILSELGYSSTSGETLQAAAFAYAYKKMVANGHIDAMMLSRQTDAADEIAAFGLALGLETTSGQHKYIYEVYKYIDTDLSEQYTAFAEDIVGVDFD